MSDPLNPLLHPSGRPIGGEKDLSARIKSNLPPKSKFLMFSLSLTLYEDVSSPNHLTFFGLGDPIPCHPILLGVGRGRGHH